jgi:hypothetical protein
MSLLKRYTDTCIAAATRRWPADLADDMSQAWHAEMVAVHDDSTLPTLTRAWRQIGFATSLAMSPSVGAEHSMRLTWRDRLPGLGQAAKTMLGVAGIALMAILLPFFLNGFWSNLNQHTPASFVKFTWPITTVAAIAVMWWLGSSIGRRASIATSHR